MPSCRAGHALGGLGQPGVNFAGSWQPYVFMPNDRGFATKCVFHLIFLIACYRLAPDLNPDSGQDQGKQGCKTQGQHYTWSCPGSELRSGGSW
eukprot:1095268-Pelagomonas_calceolata.AAC.3